MGRSPERRLRSRPLLAGAGLACSLLLMGLAVPVVALAQHSAPASASSTPASRTAPTPPPRRRAEPADTTAARWLAHQGRPVRDITASGLSRTRLWRLRHHLYTKIGKPFDAETFAHDVRRVRNLELFRGIRVRVKPKAGGVAIHFHMADKWSLLPYFNAFFNLGSVSVVSGVHDVNFFGTLSYVDLQVLLFSYLPLTKTSIRPGGVFSIGLPRLFGRALRYDVDVRALTTIRTVLRDHRTVGGYYRMERYGGYHAFSYEPFPFLSASVRQTITWDQYRPTVDGGTPTVPTPETGLTHSIALSATLGYLSYREFLIHGLQLWMSLEGAADWMGSDFSFTRLTADLRGFWRFGPRGGNLGVWLHGGYMKGGGYPNFYLLGSWTGLRGFYTQQLAARSYVLGTFEYRSGLLPMDFPIAWIVPYFRGKALRIQAAAFVDLGAVAGAGPWRPRESGKLLMSVGAGLRFMVVKVYKACLRLDFAYTVSPYRSFDLIIAAQQFF